MPCRKISRILFLLGSNSSKTEKSRQKRKLAPIPSPPRARPVHRGPGEQATRRARGSETERDASALRPRIPLLSCPSRVSVSAADRSVCGSKQCTLRSKDVCPGSDNTLPPPRPSPLAPRPFALRTDGRHPSGDVSIRRVTSRTSLMF